MKYEKYVILLVVAGITMYSLKAGIGAGENTADMCTTTGAVDGIANTCMASAETGNRPKTVGKGNYNAGSACGHKWNPESGEFDAPACNGNIVDTSSNE